MGNFEIRKKIPSISRGYGLDMLTFFDTPKCDTNAFLNELNSKPPTTKFTLAKEVNTHTFLKHVSH